MTFFASISALLALQKSTRSRPHLISTLFGILNVQQMDNKVEPQKREYEKPRLKQLGNMGDVLPKTEPQTYHQVELKKLEYEKPLLTRLGNMGDVLPKE